MSAEEMGGGEMMGDEDDGEVKVGVEAFDDVKNLATRGGVKIIGGFVEDEELVGGGESTGEEDTLALATGEGGERGVEQV